VRLGEPLLLQRQEHGRLPVGFALWGLVPEWNKDPLGRRRPINARCETVAEKPFLRGPWRHRRALLPDDGFYEWQNRTYPATGKVWKQPSLFRRRWVPFSGSAASVIACEGLMAASRRAAWCSPPPPTACCAGCITRMPVVIPEGLEEGLAWGNRWAWPTGPRASDGAQGSGGLGGGEAGADPLSPAEGEESRGGRD
jgi:hypothetical protein